MHDFDAQHDLWLARVFYEFRTGTTDGLQAFAADVCALEAARIIVPSLAHLAEHCLLQALYIERLEQRTNAAVVSMAGPER
jgi:hypothetical protein